MSYLILKISIISLKGKAFKLFYLSILIYPYFSICQLPLSTFGVDKGLSQGSNYFMQKDSKGYLWISSNDGLNRFDGRDFVSYYNNPLDSNSILGSYINNFAETKNGYLHVATSKGLSVLNSTTNKFTKINLFKNALRSEIDTYILSLNGDTLLLIDDINGLYSINTNTNKLINLDSNIKIPVQYYGVFSICYFAKEAHLVFATKEGLAIYNTKKKEVLTLDLINPIFKLNYINRIFCVSFFANNVAALGTNNGVLLLDFITGKLINHIKLPQKNKSEVYAIKKDEKDDLWIGSNDNKIYKYRKNDLKTVDIGFVNLLENKLKDVSGFYFTKENVFFNEDPKGLGVLNRNVSYIKSFSEKNSVDFKGNAASVYCFAEDNDQNIWIGKSTNGILIYNIKNKQFKDFEEKFNCILPSRSIKSILINNKSVYIGTQNGLFVFDLISKDLLPLQLPINYTNQESKWINHIVKLKNGKIVFGTRDGIFEIRNNKIFSLSNTRKFGYYIFENDKYQILTTGLSSNLDVFSLQNDTLFYENTYLENFSVLGIWQNPHNNEYWFACREGIVHTNFKYEILHYFSTKTGLKSNCFYGIVFDGNSKIYAISNKAIVTIDLSTNTPYYFFNKQEISSLEYNGKGFLKSTKGKLYFGGENGFDEFDQILALQKMESKYTLQIEEIKINELQLKDKQYDDLELKVLRLNYNENNLSLRINAVNCENSSKPILLYNIEGIQDEWTEIYSQDWIRIVKIKPGTYYLNCKFKESLLGEAYRLKIVIKPAWFQTLWFKFFIVMLFSGILYFLYKFRINQLKKVLAVRRKISSDLHDDIGSTLSTINMFSQVAKMQDNTSPYVTNIQENTKIVLDKLDDIVWATNPKNDKIENLAERIEGFARPLFKAKNIAFKFDCDASLNAVKISENTRQNLFLICKEAINNTAKYANAKHCNIVLAIKSKQVFCTITDDGIGFNTTLPTERNGLINMENRAKQLKGYFEIKSTVNKGTEIQVRLPL